MKPRGLLAAIKTNCVRSFPPSLSVVLALCTAPSSLSIDRCFVQFSAACTRGLTHRRCSPAISLAPGSAAPVLAIAGSSRRGSARSSTSNTSSSCDASAWRTNGGEKRRAVPKCLRLCTRRLSLILPGAARRCGWRGQRRKWIQIQTPIPKRKQIQTQVRCRLTVPLKLAQT